MHIKGLGFRYRNGSTILDDVNLDFENTELVSILGPNGVGKTTLMHCMNGLLTPTAGSVSILGKNVREYGLRELARQVAYVSCSRAGAFPMTVLDMVLLGRNPVNQGRRKDDDFEMAYRALDAMDVLNLSTSMVNELSAGQYQRVMLARGLVQESKILLLDEPTSNLDIKHQANVSATMRRMAKDLDMLVIMICHDINLASKYSDSIVMMSRGTVFASGSPADVVTESNIRAVYGIESRIISDQGRPHMLMVDPDLGFDGRDGSE